MNEHGEELTPAVRAAVRQLHDAPLPEISDVWRQRVLRRVASGDYPRDHLEQSGTAVRRWSMRPSTAIAAGILCVLVGGGGVYVAERAARAVERETLAVSRLQKRGLTGSSDVRFRLVAPSAQRVSVVGDFNGWDATSLPMRRSPDGTAWEVVVPLAPGRYAYSFVVDGVLAKDPVAPSAADDDFGTPNSVLLVRGS